MIRFILLTIFALTLNSTVSAKSLKLADNNIAGKYEVYESNLQSIEYGNLATEINVIADYNESHSFNYNGTIRLIYKIPEGDYINTMIFTFDLQRSGKWSVEGNNLIEDNSPDLFKIKFTDSKATVENGTYEKIKTNLKNFAINNHEQIEKELNSDKKYNINEIDKNFIVLSLPDKHQIKYKRIN